MTTRTNMNREHNTTTRLPTSSSSSSRTTTTTNHQQNHNNNGYYPNHNYTSGSRTTSSSSSRASFKGCCCCLFLLLTFIGLLILAVILVIVLAVKPKKPQFELQQVRVEYVGIVAGESSISSNIPSASLSFSIRMIFTAVNPNKVGIKYSPTEFNLMYKGIPLGRASVLGFYQPAHSVRQVETTVVVDRVNLLQAQATDLVKDAKLYDRVELRITGDVGAKIRILDFTSPRVKVSVDCAIVISPKKNSLTYKQCGVDGLNV